MTIEAIIALALWALCAWFVNDHFLNHHKRETWEQYPDLDDVDLTESTRARAVKESDRLAFEERVAEYRARAHADLVTRRERMRHHPQPWHL